MTVVKQCQNSECNTSFPVTRNDQKYCSAKCRKRSKYFKRKAMGLCVVCGRPNDSIHAACENCLGNARNRYRGSWEHRGITAAKKAAKDGVISCDIFCAYLTGKRGTPKYDDLWFAKRDFLLTHHVLTQKIEYDIMTIPFRHNDWTRQAPCHRAEK